MSGLLDGVTRDFDARMATRRAMLAHLGIDLGEAATMRHREDIRATMIGCARCTRHATCAQRLAWRRPGDGIPETCICADAFLRLEMASRQERAAQDARKCG